jgi:hypothetical protein
MNYFLSITGSGIFRFAVAECYKSMVIVPYGLSIYLILKCTRKICVHMYEEKKLEQSKPPYRLTFCSYALTVMSFEMYVREKFIIIKKWSC